jgi:carbonic anhydrase
MGKKIDNCAWLVLLGCLWHSCAMAAEVNDAGVKVKWSYVGSDGPVHWGMLSKDFELCDTGRAQSPVNLGRNRTRAPYALKINYQPSPLFIGEDLTTELVADKTKIAVDTGHTIQVNFHGKKVRETITYNGNTYDLVQFHFHSPSETLWHKQSFPLEIHFVHQGKDGTLAVLGVFVKGGEENPAIAEIVKNMPAEEKKEFAVKDVNINPAQLLPENKRYFAYMGSLTTPPCVEGVQWIVMPEPITASPAQILTLREAAGGNNARPVQPLNNRVLSYAVE